MSGGRRPALPYLDDAALASEPARHAAAERIRLRRAGARLLNLDRMLLHSPAFAAGWSGLLGAVRGQLSLDPALRELVICAIARINAAPYEWHQHIGEWQAAGARPGQAEALQRPPEAWGADPAFDALERQVLALTLASTRAVGVDANLIASLSAQLGAQALVELVGTVATYNMVSRFLVALGVDASGETEG